MGSIINQEDSHLDSVQAAIDFISLRSDTERLAEEIGKDVDELEVVEDPFFATVLNPKGEIQIGDMVYKVTRDYVYRVLESNIDELSSISLRNQDNVLVSQKFDHGPAVEVFQVERHDMANKSAAISARKNCEAYFTSSRKARRRVKGQAWITNYYIFWSATTEIEYQRKSWGRWWRTTATWVSLDARYSLSVHLVPPGGAPLPPIVTSGTYSHKKYNASEIRKNLDWTVPFGDGVVVMRGWISSTYRAKRLDGLQRSCSTYVRR